MIIWEYATSPTTGTVHLTHPYGSQPVHRTLCGKLAGAMITGDETPYGSQVTCLTCVKVRAIQVDAQPGRIDRAVVDHLLAGGR
jgi:hypothetical protein